jgi:FkbM family methyltransferase
VVSSAPDHMLQAVMRLPSPANRLAFGTLRRVFQTYGRLKPTLTRIRFGDIEIEAPLEHPAVYWRYRPPGFNMNYVRLVKTITAAKTGIIIDVGANIGDGVALLRANGVKSRIVAIEGADEFVSLLEKNVQSLFDVEVLSAFLGEAGLAVDLRLGSAKLVPRQSGIKTSTLDALLHSYDYGRISVLKIDTDGFDAKVLRGAENILEHEGPIVFAELDDVLLREQGDTPEALLDILEKRGYAHIAVWDNDGRWLGQRPMEKGLADWIANFPGGFGQQYLDIAAFKNADRALLDEATRIESRYSV